MKMGTAFRDFEETYIKPRLTASLKEAEALFQKEKDSFRKQFLQDMEQVCERRNKSGEDIKIAYMDWELLRTNLHANQDVYRIMLYQDDWFLSDGIEAGATDVSLIMELYHGLERQLKEDAKRYVGNISPLAVETQTAYLLPPYHDYVTELIQYAVADATELNAFQRLNKNDKFQIRVGECLEPGRLVYMENREKDQNEILCWLESNKQNTYCFQDFRHMEFSGLELPLHDFRNTDFRDALMEQTNLCFSLLTGARFRRARLKGAKLSGSMMHGADFTGADLQKAHMEGTLMCDGKDASTKWRLAGYPSGTFNGADLSGADVRESVYCGADFAGAKLTGADFTGSSLFRCRFTKDQLEQTSFTEEQKTQILLMD